MCCRNACVILSLDRPADNIELAALILLPALLPDAKSKVDISKIVYVAKVNRHEFSSEHRIVLY